MKHLMIIVLLTTLFTLVVVLSPSADASIQDPHSPESLVIPNIIIMNSEPYDISGSDCGLTRSLAKNHEQFTGHKSKNEALQKTTEHINSFRGINV